MSENYDGLYYEPEILRERYDLAMERIREIEQEHFGEPAFEEYFAVVAGFLKTAGEVFDASENGGLRSVSLKKREMMDKALGADILPDRYGTSYANPAYAVRMLGEEFGRLLSFLYYEMRSLIPFVCAGRLTETVIRMELFVEVYASFVYEWQESGSLPEYETVRQIIYWYAFDYADIAAEQMAADYMAVRSEGTLADGCWTIAESLCGSESILYDSGAGVPEELCIGVSRQCEYDHREDIALFLDKAYINRRLEALKTACERCRDRVPEKPVDKAEVIRMTGDQRKLWKEYCDSVERIRQNARTGICADHAGQVMTDLV